MVIDMRHYKSSDDIGCFTVLVFLIISAMCPPLAAIILVIVLLTK